MPSSSPVNAGNRRLSWKSRVLLVGFGVLMATVLVEAGLRVTDAIRERRANVGWGADRTPTSEYWAIYDPDLGYRQNPKFPEMNAEGLRDRAIGPKGDRFRVLFMGDSVAVYGDSVDDTFVGHLRTSLHANPSFEKVDVINAGIKGYTNYQEVLFLKKFGLGFKPDLVGFEFCLNDLFKFLHSFEVENGQLVSGTYGFATQAVAKRQESSGIVRLAKQSRLLVWLRNNLSVARNAAEWGATQGFSFDHRMDVRNAWDDEPWRAIERQLAEAVTLGQTHGFPVFVVAFPLAAQYTPDYLAKDREYVLKPQAKLREICERLEIPYYDIYPELEARDFSNDGLHLNAEGRVRAGRAVSEFLTRSGLLLK